jgi:hypothetical protein
VQSTTEQAKDFINFFGWPGCIFVTTYLFNFARLKKAGGLAIVDFAYTNKGLKLR